VTCPGKSLEPFVGSNMTLKDKTFVNEYILVEIASSFAYRFEKQERVVIGSCEWCNQKNVLQYICKCKRVRYCDEACMEKDKRFHFP
jgi:ubiquitin carboxyl-terminal hydrolase 4/11/15